MNHILVLYKNLYFPEISRYWYAIHVVILTLLVCLILQLHTSIVYSTSQDDQPTIEDLKLDVQLVVEEGLSSPTSMAFINENNILVLEKNSGNVKLVTDGVLKADPILHLEVDNTTLTCCRGLLGVVIT